MERMTFDNEVEKTDGLTGPTVVRCFDLPADLPPVRRLPPVHADAGRRLVKSPRICLRASGPAHSPPELDDREETLSHPVAGGRREGRALESLPAVAPARTRAWLCRTAASAEVGLRRRCPETGCGRAASGADSP